ncbi:bifunctional methylenetetrahydrofolate dehydrogenase/methenyltetrahydrofolate cyclohydrolase FolD [Numidum massiliense]|uniref:bifunctional methylenetetrahydrofolate dehydrogenase/methenyltetrahydrofolate cyclohydrolase FolD n=1 Tax=Numidum massiliense TaxID=1522315 RepID=UPI0006D59D0E|nr:bifunctional methylenetetrahydrofolate dehydrogenase/methenyltetrahydrofolate cyclohydrolase FolD [Numidum massiliense]
MTATIIDGKQLAAQKRKQLTTRVEALVQRGVTPGLTVILVGDDPASATYVRGKEKACQAVGINSRVVRLPAATSEAELLAHVHACNEDASVDGILVQLPLPRHIDERKIIQAIDPAKDVDGFHPVNMGNLVIGTPGFLPCTPYGIMEMFKAYDISLAGKHAVVIGRSNIVGKPIALLMQREHATVTMCHSRTQDLAEVTRTADVVVAAVGRAHLVTGDFIKPGAVVIDVGMNRLPNGKLTGDVAYDDVKETAAYMTPVPGGVGPMTIAMLLYNTVQSAEQRL